MVEHALMIPVVLKF